MKKCTKCNTEIEALLALCKLYEVSYEGINVNVYDNTFEVLKKGKVVETCDFKFDTIIDTTNGN